MTDLGQIKFSVIIPVYNAAEYLEEMLDSITEQTLREVEIICVDDGSVDDSVRILKRYQERDFRIRLYAQPHRGAATARNLGIKKANGEYMIFLDADDFFEKTLLEKAYKKGIRTSADVVLFGAKRYDNRTGELKNAPRYLWRKLLPEQEVFSRRDMDGDLFCLTTPSPWTKAFRRDFILKEDITFQDLPNSNDVRFVLTALGAAERIAAVREDLVYYRVFREGSLQDQKYRDPLCFLTAYEAAYDELNRRGVYPEVEKGFASMVLSGCAYNLRSVQDEPAKWEMIRALCSERFTHMGLLEHPEEYYDMPEYRDQIKGLPYALRIREDQEARRLTAESASFLEEKRNVYAGKDNACGKEIKVSVIVAVYNMERYLEDCLDSLLAQTLREIEIICINDGSVDSSLYILEKYAEKDARIAVYGQKNAGLSVTRNRGLLRASGEYVYFMDSDDMLRPNALEELYKKSVEKKLDVLYFNGRTFYENKTLQEKYPEFEGYYGRKGRYPELCTGPEMFRQMRELDEYRTNVGIQFFCRTYLLEQNLTFQPGILHEDNAFTFQAMLLAERAGYMDRTFFDRRVRENSIMTAEAKFAHTYGYFKSFLCMQFFVLEHEFPEEIADVLFLTLKGVIENARTQYNRLGKDERYASWGLYGPERALYRVWVEGEASSHEKLQKTYREKSEINRKLQITYDEKFERGVEIKRLNKELDRIKRSRSYRLARMIGAPMRLVRMIKKKLQRG